MPDPRENLQALRDKLIATGVGQGQFEYIYPTVKGDRGDKGEKGDSGDVGLTGPKGDNGDIGPTQYFFRVADAAAATILANITTVSTLTYSSLGDRGGAPYIRVTSEPTHIAKFRSADRFLPDGSVSAASGGWWEIAADVIRTRMVGLLGVAGEDVTSALNSILSTGRNIYIEPTSGEYTISGELSVLSNQRLFGSGLQSTIRQTGVDKNVITMSGTKSSIVESLSLKCVGTLSNLATGGGVLANACDGTRVANCFISGHRGTGVNFINTSNGNVSGNVFTDSPVQAGELNTRALGDISFLRGSSNNTAERNICISGNGTGILIQAISAGERCRNNRIINNFVRGARSYGIFAYRLGEGSIDNTVQGTIIANNVVEDIKGDISNTATNTYAFGCGIYVQGAEESSVLGNVIDRAHSGGVTVGENLAPGAIGVTNVTRVSVIGNIIRDAGHAGIWISEGNNAGLPTGFCIVQSNIISGSVQAGIRLDKRGRVKLIGNTLDTTKGIRVSNTTVLPDIDISTNTIRNTVDAVAAIQVVGVSGLRIVDNMVDKASVHGIIVDTSDVVSLSDNTVIGHATRGIQVQSGCTQVQVYNNNVKGSSSVEGIRLEAAARYDNNQITGCTSSYAGNFGPWRDLTVNSTTPSIADGREFSFNNTAATTVTQFTGGSDGQEIWIRAKDANTTLKMSGVTNLKGNGGVDRLLKVGDFVVAKYHGGVGAWMVMIVAAT